MADETKPAVEPVKPYVFDTTAFENKVTALQADAKAKAGKPNYNPFKWAADSGFDELVAKYKLGEKSQALFDAMQQLPKEIPVLDPNWQPPVAYKAEVPKALRPPGK